MPPRGRPRNYVPLDVDYFRQDTIRDLLARFGCDGPSVMLVVIAEAHRQAHAGPHSRQGEVDVRLAALAGELCLDVSRVEEIVAACVGLELLERLDAEAGRLRARLSKWQRWESKDVTAAGRQRRSRAAPDKLGPC